MLPKGGYDGTGQQLKDAIDGLQTKIGQVETTLSVDDTAFDTLQEIVTQVKSNKNLETLLTDKVNKEDGKGLSTNDFTNELKQKLEQLPYNALERREVEAIENRLFNYIERELTDLARRIEEKLRVIDSRLAILEAKG